MESLVYFIGISLIVSFLLYCTVYLSDILKNIEDLNREIKYMNYRLDEIYIQIRDKL